jgi:hypothetical protein
MRMATARLDLQLGLAVSPCRAAERRPPRTRGQACEWRSGNHWKQPEFSVRSAAEWGTGECDEVDQEDRRGHEVDDRGWIFSGRRGD